VIPKRSVENRLNSLYCQHYPKVSICQPTHKPHWHSPKSLDSFNAAVGH
jgi:hypothetical protein